MRSSSVAIEASLSERGSGGGQGHWTFYSVERRHGFRGRVGPAHWQPNVDVYETPEGVVVLVELAGVRPESVDIGVEGRRLRIAGARSPRFGEGYRQFHRLEIPQGKFERVIDLPRTVDSAAARAEYTDGFLEVRLPFAQPVRVQVGRETGDL